MLKEQLYIRKQSYGRQSNTEPVSNIKTDVLPLLGHSQSHRARGRLRTEGDLPGTNPQMPFPLPSLLNALSLLLPLKHAPVK